jgi:hypothetical protein
MLENSWVADQVTASQEGLSSTDLVRYNNNNTTYLQLDAINTRLTREEYEGYPRVSPARWPMKLMGFHYWIKIFVH